MKADKECLLFMGRWSPLHKGHTAMIQSVLQEHPGAEVLILVKNSTHDEFTAEERLQMVQLWLSSSGIPGTAMIIPDATGIYYGRDVGYEVEKVNLPVAVQRVSGTGIREMIHQEDLSWRNLVACPEVADLVSEILSGKD